jgi:hypothetical protein
VSNIDRLNRQRFGSLSHCNRRKPKQCQPLIFSAAIPPKNLLSYGGTRCVTHGHSHRATSAIGIGKSPLCFELCSEATAGSKRTRCTSRWFYRPVSFRNECRQAVLVPMVRIGSRKWSVAQIAHLTALIDEGTTAAHTAIALKRSAAKARCLGKPFQAISTHS